MGLPGPWWNGQLWLTGQGWHDGDLTRCPRWAASLAPPPVAGSLCSLGLTWGWGLRPGGGDELCRRRTGPSVWVWVPPGAH